MKTWAILLAFVVMGGAVVPLLMGKLVDSDLGAKAFIIPVACFVYLMALSLKGGSKPKTASRCQLIHFLIKKEIKRWIAQTISV